MRNLIFVIVVASITTACRRETTAPPERAAEPGARESSGRITPRTKAVQSYADVVDRVIPAVVTIRSARRARAPQQFPFFSDPFFRRFFGGGGAPRQAPQQQQVGLGSGVIVTTDGYTLTNHHVVDGAEEIEIEMPDHRSFRPKLVGSDPPSDLAVLKIDSGNLPTLPLGNSDDVRVGDVALAIGNPLGIGQTVTAGIISAKGRSTGLSNGSFEDFLQTDAPINRGNSGGALVNTASELIGINSQILSPTGANIGIGFAIPSNMAKTVMDQLIKDGKVSRGAMEIQIQPVTREVAEKAGLKDTRGVLVRAVTPGGPADRAGMKPGDVIIGFNGKPVEDMNSFRLHVSGTPPGTEVPVRVLRNGREQDLRVRLGEFKPQPPQERQEEPDVP